MTLRRTLPLASLLAGLVLGAGTACQTERTPPDNTDPFEPTGGKPIGQAATSGTGSSASSSSSSGTGGAGPYQPKVSELTCADSLAHVTDCEACMYTQTMQFCSMQWIDCGDEPWCESGFHACSIVCTPGDFDCLTACFNKDPGALDVILPFNACVCANCASVCN